MTMPSASGSVYTLPSPDALARPAPRQHQLAASHHATVTQSPSALLATPRTRDPLMCSASSNDPADHDTQPSAHLRDALHDAAGEAHASTVALRDAVCRYVEDGRRSGLGVDEIVDALKHLVARLRHAGAIPPAPAGPDVFIAQLVAWCLEFGAA